MSTTTLRTHYNIVVVGESGSGKSLLSALLTNQETDQGCYFHDPDFEGANIRVNPVRGVTFVDTKPLTFDEDFSKGYLLSLVQELHRRHLRVTGWIFCIRYGRIKKDCIQLLRWVLAVSNQPVDVFISNSLSPPIQMMEELRQKCGINVFFWLKAEVTEEFDERLGRWILLDEETEKLKDKIFQKHGL